MENLAAQLNVAVVGGGYAGLAAAVELAHAGISATVFESAKTLGGRARRVDYRGQILDNGQHLLLGAYHELLRLMRLVGVPDDAVLRTPLKLTVPGQFSLDAPRLPAPLHLLAALLNAQGLSLADRIATARFMLAMRRRRFYLGGDTSVAALLEKHHQSAAIRRFLWEPLCCAALNTPPEIASAQVFLNVLRDSFDRRRADSDMLIPRVDAAALFANPAARFIEKRGGTVCRSTTVRNIAASNGRFAVSDTNHSRSFSHVICAVPPQRLAAVTAGIPAVTAAREMVERFTYQPIYSLYLRYPDHVTLPSPLLGLTGGYGQWVFDLGQLVRGKGLLCVVISAAGEHEQLPRGELAHRIHEELQRACGALPQPLWVEVIAEKRATFACTADISRPPQVTTLAGFLLAGDYTAGDYPATLEGAVRSGVAAARVIIKEWREAKA